VLVGENVTVADFVAAYTLDMASVVHLLETLPNLRAYMERMYTRAKAPQRTGVREPSRLRSPREAATASAKPMATHRRQCQQVASVGCSPVEISIFKTSRPARCDLQIINPSPVDRPTLLTGDRFAA